MKIKKLLNYFPNLLSNYSLTRNNFKLEFVKFFPVKSPIGISQNPEYVESSEYHSIGVDLHMPKMTLEFINALLKSNLTYSVKDLLKNKTFGDIDYVTLVDTNGKLILVYQNKSYIIYGNIQIPTGIGILIPKNYYIDLRSKSSNFKYHFTLVTGLIDEDYTYGMGMQLIPIEKNNAISFLEDQKICQIVLKRGYKISKFEELSIFEWEKKKGVQVRRLTRTGGFGSKGKF